MDMMKIVRQIEIIFAIFIFPPSGSSTDNTEMSSADNATQNSVGSFQSGQDPQILESESSQQPDTSGSHDDASTVSASTVS